MTPPRFRLRTLMVVVAVAALALAGEATRRRMARLSSEYQAKAQEWYGKATLAERYEYKAADPLEMGRPPVPERVRLAESASQMVKYTNAMAEKYRQAAARPWLPVAPDPPEPE